MNSLIPDSIKHYYNNGEKKIIKVVPNDDYSLILLFNNGEYRSYSMEDKLFGVFEVLKNLEKFRQVFIDESGNIAWDRDSSVDSTVFWNNRIDICKDSLYVNSNPITKGSDSWGNV